MSIIPVYTVEQAAAAQSRVLCRCGHMEMEHVLPSPPGTDDFDAAHGRECIPRNRGYGINGDEGREGCACTDFSPAEKQPVQTAVAQP